MFVNLMVDNGEWQELIVMVNNFFDPKEGSPNNFLVSDTSKSGSTVEETEVVEETLYRKDDTKTCFHNARARGSLHDFKNQSLIKKTDLQLAIVA